MLSLLYLLGIIHWFFFFFFVDYYTYFNISPAEEINEIFFYERIYDIAVQAIDNGIFPVFEGHPVSFSVGEFWAKTVEGYIMNRPGCTDS